MAPQGNSVFCRCPYRFQIMFIRACAVTVLVWLLLYALAEMDVRRLEAWKVSQFLQKAVHNLHATISFPKKPRQRKIVLLWTDYFGKTDWLPSTESLGCPVKECDVTSNRNLLPNSSAVILHWRSTNIQDLPDCVPSESQKCPSWVLFNKEAPPHTSRLFLEALEKNVRWTATYRRESELYAPYGKIEPAEELNYVEPDFDRKRQLMCWLVSNCNTPSKREEFVVNMSNYVDVDIYGKCGMNTCPHEKVKDCYVWLSERCKFYFSLENSNCKDYVTEKLFYALSSGMVPIVNGNNSNYDFLPPRSYINAADYSSPKELAVHLVTVGNDKDLYLSYFWWKKKFKVVDYAYRWFCQLCEKLHDDSIESIHSRNLTSWWFDESECMLG